MMEEKLQKLKGATLFEVSWEVCNKVGGIYAVVSSKVLEVVEHFGENYYLIGPDLGANKDFQETDEACWKEVRPVLEQQNIACRFGRWNIPGKPKVILVKFKDRYNSGQLLYELWNSYGVDSLSGGWDYVEPVMFSTVCGEVIANLYKVLRPSSGGAFFAHFHEWMCGAGLLQVRKHVPEIGTVFTTHATVLGRSMAGSGFDIYKQMQQINPKQEAGAYNITAKCSMETVSAQNADCFTTVGHITADEAALFLGRFPDVLTLNGLDLRIIPDYASARAEPEAHREKILQAAGKLLRQELPRDTRIFITSGRYEYHNKGIDLFMDALADLKKGLSASPATVLALCAVVGGHNGVNPDAVGGDNAKKPEDGGNWKTSHYIHNPAQDPILMNSRRMGLDNAPDSKVKFIFIPALLDGHDGFFNMDYYEVLSACDLGVFPSWYEPWGYTPQESVAYGVPTVTTDLAGFGIWARKTEGNGDSGVEIVSRRETTYDHSKEALHDILLGYTLLPEEELSSRRVRSRHFAQKSSWEEFFPNYLDAYVIAAEKAEERGLFDEDEPSSRGVTLAVLSNSGRPVFRSFMAVAQLPGEIARLRDLAYNFWWCWHPFAWEIFSDLDPFIWEESSHNPVHTIKHVSQERLKTLVNDPLYMRLYDDVVKAFDRYMQEPLKNFGSLSAERPLAYFSTEYGLNECLPIYSGGLGVLSGDHLKSASDLSVPLVGVGILYKNGYFEQQIDKSGRQTEVYPESDFDRLPMTAVQDAQGQPLVISMAMPSRTLFAKVWVVLVGRVPLYLMDTDIPQNIADDRKITARLYEADRDIRLRQEMLLGIGGVRLLDALNIKPSAYHMNEGHSAFLIIERIRQLVQNEKMSFEEAGEYVRGSSLFTTHTPIDAGNEVFGIDRIKDYFMPYIQQMGISWQDFLNMGHFEGSERSNLFEMTVLALKYSYKANGVSRLHSYVARNMWSQGWKRIPTAETPIGYVTNGVHLASYASVPARLLFYHHEFGEEWIHALPDSPIWNKVKDIPHNQIWGVKQLQKNTLLTKLRETMPAVFKKFSVGYDAQKEMLAGLNENALVICFARRFAPYKRANLLFADPERLHKIISNAARPVIFIFAGKAHPADTQGRDIVQSIIQHMLEPRFLGKIFFIENYDLSVSRLMVQGCDVWMNTPRRPYEASGTSGQKVTVNGGLNLSISDGWWCEGYNGQNGWTIGAVVKDKLMADQSDYADASALYELLEEEIIPAYYNRSSDNIPHAWLDIVKNAMQTLIAQYSSSRMMSEYLHGYYIPTADRAAELFADGKKLAKSLVIWKHGVAARFNTMKIEEIVIEGLDSNQLPVNQPINVKVSLYPGDMMPDELLVEFIVGLGNEQDFMEMPDVMALTRTDTFRNRIIYKGRYSIRQEGKHSYGVRVFPVAKGLSSPLDTHLVLWG